MHPDIAKNRLTHTAIDSVKAAFIKVIPFAWILGRVQWNNIINLWILQEHASIICSPPVTGGQKLALRAE
jgi:hypothetical protein